MPSKDKKIFFKLLSLFSVVRGYNILVIVVAQYLASIFIIAPDYLSAKEIIFDQNLFFIVLSSALTIAGGYIINNFYDSAKDLINRPQKTYLDNYVSQQSKLTTYFLLNFLCVVISSYVAFKAVLFFVAYIFALWLYSHKLKKILLVGNIIAATLAVTPFFAVFIYFQNFDLVIFVHALFLYLIIIIRELVKDLENIKGDFAQDYPTLPVKFGEATSKLVISFLVLLTFAPVVLLLTKYEVGYMNYYFILSTFLLGLFIYFLWVSKSKIQYVWLHNLLKFIIVFGVACILLIDVDVVIKKLI